MQTSLAAIDEACNAGVDGKVIPVDIAAAKALAIVRSVGETNCVGLIEAAGRVLAFDLAAALDLPLFDNSAMDGYAVRISDFMGDGP